MNRACKGRECASRPPRRRKTGGKQAKNAHEGVMPCKQKGRTKPQRQAAREERGVGARQRLEHELLMWPVRCSRADCAALGGREQSRTHRSRERERARQGARHNCCRRLAASPLRHARRRFGDNVLRSARPACAAARWRRASDHARARARVGGTAAVHLSRAPVRLQERPKRTQAAAAALSFRPSQCGSCRLA